jgi:hypothetical protein
LHRQAGIDQTTAAVAQRQLLGIASHMPGGTTLYPRVAEHAFGNVQCHTDAVRKTLGQNTAEVAGAAAQVEPLPGLQAFWQSSEQ